MKCYYNVENYFNEQKNQFCDIYTSEILIEGLTLENIKTKELIA